MGPTYLQITPNTFVLLELCTALKYAMDHRHADVAAIFLSYRYTKYALTFPKIPVVLGRPYRSGISAVRAVKWGLFAELRRELRLAIWAVCIRINFFLTALRSPVT